jgi:hypothetical protein
MIRREELIADALALLHEHGFTPRIQENGKHVKIRWLDAGRRYTWLFHVRPATTTRVSGRAPH